MNIKYK